MRYLNYCTSCSEFALLASGASIAGTQNAYARIYNGVDMLTIVNTKKKYEKACLRQREESMGRSKRRKETYL